MSCTRPDLRDYLANFTGQDPIDAVVCPFTQDAGAGMGIEVFSLFVIGGMALGLTIRTRHPGPILVAGILSAGLFAASLPGLGAKIFALVLFFGLAAAALYLYQRGQSAL